MTSSAGNPFTKLKLDPTKPARHQITDFVRDLIVQRQLPSGARVPSIQELAILWATNHFTVQTALKSLMNEGFLERRPRVGTYVRAQEPKLTSIGIYYGVNLALSNARSFHLTLQMELQNALRRQGLDAQVWIETRAGGQQGEPLPDLAAAAKTRSIQGLIATALSPLELEWLRKLPVPVAGFSSFEGISPRISFDHRQMFEFFFRKLSTAGIRKVGLIVPFAEQAKKGDHEDHSSFFLAFRNAAREYALEVRPEWLLVPPAGVVSNERYGYDSFHALWRLRNRPEAVAVYPDTAARGAVTASMELGVPVPQSLVLALHRNRGVEFVCPLPALWAETAVDEIADALVDQVVGKFHRRPALDVTIPFYCSVDERAIVRR